MNNDLKEFLYTLRIFIPTIGMLLIFGLKYWLGFENAVIFLLGIILIILLTFAYRVEVKNK
jgi:predicted RND superfamily exporter protein